MRTPLDAQRTKLVGCNSIQFVCLCACYHQLHVGVEAIRCTEILFQPSLVGSPEAGLAELIEYVLRTFTAAEQEAMCSNVFLTGGCASLPGKRKRAE